MAFPAVEGVPGASFCFLRQALFIGPVLLTPVVPRAVTPEIGIRGPTTDYT
jgi:hypothetical protein